MLCIGIKYCGGCMPEYDRLALVENLKDRLGDKVEMVHWDCPDTAFTLVVAGCPNACADIRDLCHKPVFHLRGPADAASLIKLIESEHIDEMAKLLP